MVVAPSAPSLAYDPGYPFNKYKLDSQNEAECGSYGPAGALTDSGPVRFSCRVTALSSLPNDKDAVYKFLGRACSRGSTRMMAEFHANSHADELVHKLESNKAAQLAILPQSLKRVKTDTHCVEVGAASPSDGLSFGDQEMEEARRQEEARAEQERVEARAAARADADARRRRERTATFILHNRDRYALGAEFYSQDRSAAWPGRNKQYILKSDGTYDLDCRPGEKICYGAWRDHQTIYWPPRCSEWVM
jgi:hypothetical protein